MESLLSSRPSIRCQTEQYLSLLTRRGKRCIRASLTEQAKSAATISRAGLQVRAYQINLPSMPEATLDGETERITRCFCPTVQRAGSFTSMRRRLCNLRNSSSEQNANTVWRKADGRFGERICSCVDIEAFPDQFLRLWQNYIRCPSIRYISLRKKWHW